ncbi:uncharacterized protein LOC144617980 [Crassostrea virginica]
MPKIHTAGRGPPEKPVSVEEATSSSTVPSTTQQYVSTNRPDITTQNHSTTQTISPLSQQANISNETVAIVCVVLVIVLICVFAAFLYIIIRKKRNNRNNRPQEEANNRSQEEALTVSLTDLDTPENLNDTVANTSVSPLLNTDDTGACSENG